MTLNVTETPELVRRPKWGNKPNRLQSQRPPKHCKGNFDARHYGYQMPVVELPLSNRNYTQIVALSAGVSGSVNNATAFGKGTQDFSVNGADPGQNNYQMDGVAINNAPTAAVPTIPASMRASAFPVRTPFRNSRSRRPPTMPATGATPAPTSTWLPRPAPTLSRRRVGVPAQRGPERQFVLRQSRRRRDNSKFCARTSLAATSADRSRKTRFSSSATTRTPVS